MGTCRVVYVYAPYSCTFGGGRGGSNWLTLVRLSSSKYLEHVLLLGADHMLAYPATLVICGHLQGGSVINLMNTLKSTSESKQDQFFVFMGWFNPQGHL